MTKGSNQSTTRDFDLDLLPGYHETHGYRCLPDITWRSRLGPFVERHAALRVLLKEASRTRRSKKSNEGVLRIATVVLSLEVLAGRCAGWSYLFPEAGERARILLRRAASPQQTPLMDCYVYSSKHISSNTIAVLTPPTK
jgi:hypothetical protein